jgi:hypothetical protein
MLEFSIGSVDERAIDWRPGKSVTLEFGPIGVWLHRLVVRRQLERMIPSVLPGLKGYVESGEVNSRRLEYPRSDVHM